MSQICNSQLCSYVKDEQLNVEKVTISGNQNILYD